MADESLYAFIINNCQSLGFTDNDTSFQGVRVLPETIGQLHNSLTSKVSKEVYVGDKIVYDLKEGLGLPPQQRCKGVVVDIEFDYGYYENVRVYGTIHDKQTDATKLED